MAIFLTGLICLVVGFAAGIIFKSKLVAAEQSAAAALKSKATKVIGKL